VRIDLFGALTPDLTGVLEVADQFLLLGIGTQHRLIQWPASLDMVVTANMFGDILVDEASVLSGSMGSVAKNIRSRYAPSL